MLSPDGGTSGLVVPDFEIEAMARVLLPALRAFYASPEGQRPLRNGSASRRIHNRSGPRQTDRGRFPMR